MLSEIPTDLDRPWFLSDVVLLAEKAEGRELNGNRALLSAASPVFRTMLSSSSFEESKQSRIAISSDYKDLKELLDIIHHPFSGSPTTKLDEESLFSVFQTADKWDFPFVRKSILRMTEEVHPRLYESILETFGRSKEKNVACSLPQTFEAPWLFSDADVISVDGVKFCVCRALMSTSSYFCSQFFDQKTSIQLPLHSSVLQEILYRMHHIFCECFHEVDDPDTVVHLHLASNWLEIPRMNETELPPLDEFIRVLDEETSCDQRRELKKALTSICQKMNRDDLLNFLSSDDPRPFFSKEDIATICKITPIAERPPRVVANLQQEAESTSYMVPISFSKPCVFFNLLIKTKNGGPPLYARKEALMNHSQFFMRKFLGNEWSEGKTPEGYDIVSIDEEYPTLHRIVGIVHGCQQGIWEHHSAAFLYDVYQLSSEDKLDIPLVRDICRKVIGADCPSKLELAILLKLDVSHVLYHMPGERMRKWLDGSAASHSYIKDDKEIVFEVKSDEPIFSVDDARRMCRRVIKDPANSMSHLFDDF